MKDESTFMDRLEHMRAELKRFDEDQKTYLRKQVLKYLYLNKEEITKIINDRAKERGWL